MSGIPIGLKHEESIAVTSGLAINFMELEETRVLATPYLIWYMEVCSRNAVKRFLETGQDTVGTKVNVAHLAATPLGMTARFVSEVIEVDRRRVVFKVEAYDDKEKIGEGMHERFIVDIGKFAARVWEKRLTP